VKEREALSLERRFNVRQRENKSFADAAADEFQKWMHRNNPRVDCTFWCTLQV
jgi:hypothetical protein